MDAQTDEETDGPTERHLHTDGWMDEKICGQYRWTNIQVDTYLYLYNLQANSCLTSVGQKGKGETKRKWGNEKGSIPTS